MRSAWSGQASAMTSRVPPRARKLAGQRGAPFRSAEVTTFWNSTRVASLQANLKRFADLGLLVQLAEAEVSLGAVIGGGAQSLTAGERREALANQRERYHDMLAVCLQITGCDVDFFGFTDEVYWLTGFPFPNTEPLLFDASYRPKAVFFGARDALLGY
jgi:endo-1,4-beta-xylanase